MTDHHDQVLAQMEAIAERIQPQTRSMNSPEGEPDADTIKMFVGQIPRSWDEEELTKLFEEFGPVHQINVLKDKVTDQSRGCCFVTYFARKSALDAQNALHNIKTLPGMHHPIQMKPADSENRNERKLFIGMLSKKCNESDVRTMFAAFGTIEECTVLRDSNGQSKGCAFVTFASRQCAINAIKSMNHSQTMEGCSSPMVVKFADTQKEKDIKRQQHMMANLWNMANIANLSAITPQYLTQTSQPTFGGFANLPHLTGSVSPLGLQQQLAALAATQVSANNSNTDNIGRQLNSKLNVQKFLSGLNSLGLQSLAGQSLSPSLTLPNAGNNSTDLSAANLQSLAALANLANTAGLSPVVMQNIAALAAASSNNNSTALNLSATGNNSNSNSSVNAVNSINPVTSMTLGINSPPMGPLTGVNGSLGKASNVASNGPNLDALTQAYTGMQQFSALSGFAQLSGLAHSPAGKQIEGPEGSNLFIYHLPQEFNDTDLAQTFMPFGNVISAKVFIDKQTNLSKCFGFVSYDAPSSAQAAIQAMNGFQIGMKRLKVQLKRSKDASKPY